MTGTIGFIIGAICIGLFAWTAARAYRVVPARKLQLFTTAFGLFAIIMLLWALAVASKNPMTTREVMLATDALLLLATGCMLLSLFESTEIWMLLLIAVCASLALGLRAFRYTPAAEVRDGLLYFNLTHGLRLVILGGFLAVWVPASANIARYFRQDRLLKGLQPLLFTAFITLVLAGALFLAARRSTVIIWLYTAIAFLFLAMAAANLLILKMRHMATGGRHAAKRAR